MDREVTVAYSILPAPGRLRFKDVPVTEWDFSNPLWKGLVASSFIAEVYGDNPQDAAEKIIEKCNSRGYSILSTGDENYPHLLSVIPESPPVIYIRGNAVLGDSLSIVGTRKSDYGSAAVTERVARECASAGLVIVSGIAMGIDRHAHLGALQVNGSTIAVLPQGIDGTFPYANKDLYAMIEKSDRSCCVSEYPPGVKCRQWTFVRRNRIISGLSPVTLVVKAGERSGALITARHALEQGREIFACGGLPFDTGYDGCRKLIMEGAQILSKSSDLLECYPGRGQNTPHAQGILLPKMNQVEQKIFSLLESGSMDVDALVRQSDETTSTVIRALMMLELCGAVGRSGSIVFRK